MRINTQFLSSTALTLLSIALLLHLFSAHYRDVEVREALNHLILVLQDHEGQE